MLPYVYWNGQVMPYEQAQVGLSDLGLLRGYGIFDYFLFEDRQPRFLGDYLDRFYRSAGLLDLQVPVARTLMPAILQELIKANAQSRGGIRLLLTGGYADDGYTPRVPNLAILQYPFTEVKAEQWERGAALMTYRHQRELPQVKSINYLTGIFVQPRLQQTKADYVLYHDGEWVRESDRSNIFILTPEGVLVTPREKILLGVTRKHVLRLAQDMGLPVEERELSLRELQTAREVFLTSSTKGVLPVTRIDQRAVGDGRPGALGRQLQAAFLERLRQVV